MSYCGDTQTSKLKELINLWKPRGCEFADKILVTLTHDISHFGQLTGFAYNFLTEGEQFKNFKMNSFQDIF